MPIIPDQSPTTVEAAGPDETLLTSGEAATELRVHPLTVVRWSDIGELPCFRTLGGHRRFRASVVEELRVRLYGAPPADSQTFQGKGTTQ